MRNIRIAASTLPFVARDQLDVVRSLNGVGIDELHLDVMDGKFVPSCNDYDMQIVTQMCRASEMSICAHLMVNRINQYAQKYIDAGVTKFMIHVESQDFTDECVMELAQKVTIGIAINPTTPFLSSHITRLLPHISAIIIMTVNPGFHGQRFLENQLSKVRMARTLLSDRRIMVGVDGGVNDTTAMHAVEAGADYLVSGSYILGDPKRRVKLLRNLEKFAK